MRRFNYQGYANDPTNCWICTFIVLSDAPLPPYSLRSIVSSDDTEAWYISQCFRPHLFVHEINGCVWKPLLIKFTNWTLSYRICCSVLSAIFVILRWFFVYKNDKLKQAMIACSVKMLIMLHLFMLVFFFYPVTDPFRILSSKRSDNLSYEFSTPMLIASLLV